MTFPKRTFEKPIPISPLIALDRERCILCYRCTRFSESVAEDGQLVAINRGAQSVIATFEDEPYKGHFSGNVTEICPVGALTSTQYRFEARPWEIQNVPDRLRPLPGRLQHQRDDARGQGQAHPVAQPSRDRRGLALRQGPLRLRAPATRADRITDAARARPGRGASRSSRGTTRSTAAERLLRAGGTTTVTALSGGESVEEAYALAKLLRAGARRAQRRAARGAVRVRRLLGQHRAVRAQPLAEQLGERVRLLDRLAARERGDGRRAAGAQELLGPVERVVPRQLLEPPRAGLAERGRDPVARGQVRVGVAPLVAEPASTGWLRGLDSFEPSLRASWR